MRIRVATFVSALCLAACVGAPAPVEDPGHGPVKLGEEFTLKIGDSARVGDTGVLVMFDAVLDDSRCPRSSTCIWEGNARVKITLLEPTGRPGPKVDIGAGSFELNTSARFARRHPIDLGYLELRSLSPQPPIDDPRSYAATLFMEASK